MPDLSYLSVLFDVKETFFTVFEHPVSYVEFIGTLFGLISAPLQAARRASSIVNRKS